MLVPLRACVMAAVGAAEEPAAAAADVCAAPAAAPTVPVHLEFSGQQATLPAWSRAHEVLSPQQTVPSPILVHDKQLAFRRNKVLPIMSYSLGAR